MQDKTQTPGGDAAAQEANDAPDSGAAANPGSSEGLGQEQPSGEGPAADPWAGAALPETAEQAGAGEVAEAPAADPWGSEVADAPAADPWGGTPPPGPVEQEGPPLEDEMVPDEPSASERVEPPGSDAAPIVEGDASPLIGGGGALPNEELRDEALSGEEGEGAPHAAPADATAPADAAVGGAAVGAVGEAGGPGETIEDASEAILDPPEATDIPQAFWRPPGITEQESNNTPDPWAGAALPETAKQAGAGEVAEAPVADPWDASPTEPAGGLLDEAVRLSKEHKAAMEEAREAGRTAGEAAKDAAEDVAEAVGPRIGEVGEALEDAVEDIPLIGDALEDVVRDATDATQDALKDVSDVAYEAAYNETMWREVYDHAVPLGRELGEVQKDLAEAFEEGMGEVGDDLLDAVEDIPVVGDTLEDAVDAAEDVIDDAF